MRFNIVRDHGNFGLIRIINIRDIKDKVTVSDFQSALKRNYTPKNLINKNIKAFNYIYNILYTIYNIHSLRIQFRCQIEMASHNLILEPNLRNMKY